jgi:hypothetical protein
VIDFVNLLPRGPGSWFHLGTFFGRDPRFCIARLKGVEIGQLIVPTDMSSGVHLHDESKDCLCSNPSALPDTALVAAWSEKKPTVGAAIACQFCVVHG